MEKLRWILLASLLALLGQGVSVAESLPEDRSDLMYHHYQGGGVEVNGPAMLMRKGFENKYSLSFNYNQDTISGASPDVVSSASPYVEQRDELGFGVDYLFGNSLMNMTYTKSEENDYNSDTISLGVSHGMFGNLTTVSLGFSRGFDKVGDVTNPTFSESVNRYNYQLSLAQTLRKDLIMSFSFESISDEGYLSNPYRRLQGITTDAEVYPSTRSSNALGVRAKKYWPTLSASSRLDYRYFEDTWNVAAHTWELGYSSELGQDWLVDLYYRHYVQNKANFYQDEFQQNFNYMASDKELSSFQSNTLGAKVSFDLSTPRQWGLSKGSFNLAYELIEFDYDDYSYLDGKPYGFGANTLQLFLSLWY